MNNLVIRNGDVVLVEVEEIPNKENCVKANDLILAYGEVTGHKHALSGQQLELIYKYENTKTKEEYIEQGSNGQVQLVHEEHKTITIPKGTYKILRKQSYNPFTKQLEKDRD